MNRKRGNILSLILSLVLSCAIIPIGLMKDWGIMEYLLCCATWCGPCVKEIPYFRALAEKFKGNDRICFISLSVDSDKVGINAIPRFLLIGPDGKFIDCDCARPSDERIELILKKALAGL